MFLPRHSAKQLFFYLLEKGFAECIYLGTRRRLNSCRVQDGWQSAKSQTSPSAARLALGEIGTRQSLNFCRVPRFWYSAKFSTFRSVRQFACSSVPFQLFLPSAAWHTAKVCRVPEKRHSAKPALPGDEMPCALRQVLHSAKMLSCVIRPLPSVSSTK